ncbi:hypothetical protein RHMOL_Rhmol12G0122800 [Rhododendron molle]|uniref:Uncharacterized protein n=1 Tax=Rhododendron molle TaxID=49168 RepID=A0ACC0LIC8_RHOML|nr:hypothetical protein RHMOL_Rhmol12G0122800 [Rhododendron molle]
MIDRAPISTRNFLSQSVKEGGTAFQKAHGVEFWDFVSLDPEFQKNFCYSMEFTSRISMKAMLTEYKDGFDSIGSLLDVGGGSGFAMAEVVKVHPHIKGTNFDLPHIVDTAPWILHDWSDEDCIRILRKCQKVIPKKTGKVLILDVILQPGGDGLFDEVGMIFDSLMLVQCSGGKERSDIEWKRVLDGGGFLRYKIV